MFTTSLLIVFVLASVLFLHGYFIYPTILRLLSLFGSTTDYLEPESWPHVAIVIAAYNEESIIGEKIRNTLALTYPGRLDITVFSDASSDRTDEIVRQYKDKGVELMRIEGRVGKTECQNKVVEHLDAEIVVFSDANSMYEPDTIQKLVQRFTSDVGCVVGELRYRQLSSVEGESMYWRYESAIKRLESQVNSLIAGNGSVYAVRADSYVALPSDVISDFAEPLEIIRNGELVKYAPDAIAREKTESSTASEVNRRVRIVTRSWHAIENYPDLLNPVRHPLFAFQLWSHKILRWLSPILLTLVFVTNVGLVVTSGFLFYQLLLTGQIIFYLLAVAGVLAERLDVKTPLIIHVPFYFVYANYGMLLGLWNFVRGTNVVVWDTSSRKS